MHPTQTPLVKYVDTLAVEYVDTIPKYNRSPTAASNALTDTVADIPSHELQILANELTELTQIDGDIPSPNQIHSADPTETASPDDIHFALAELVDSHVRRYDGTDVGQAITKINGWLDETYNQSVTQYEHNRRIRWTNGSASWYADLFPVGNYVVMTGENHYDDPQGYATLTKPGIDDLLRSHY